MYEDYPLTFLENDDLPIDCEISNDMFFFRDNVNVIKEQLIGKPEKEENIYKNVPEKATAQTENEDILDCQKQKKQNNNIIIILPNENKEYLRKRGRKKKTEKNPFECYNNNHNKFKPDNIRIKIKSHYHNFIINFFNELIRYHYKFQRFKFRKISYLITKDVTIKNNIELMNMNLGDFLCQDVSRKYKCEADVNKQIVNNLKLVFQEHFSFTYSYFYKNVYINPNIKEIKKKFGLKKNIEFFYDLVNRMKNDSYKNTLIEIANKHFIETYINNKLKYENKIKEKENDVDFKFIELKKHI